MAATEPDATDNILKNGANNPTYGTTDPFTGDLLFSLVSTPANAPLPDLNTAVVYSPDLDFTTVTYAATDKCSAVNFDL